MRNRIAGIMHWEHVGIEHAQPERALKRVAGPLSRKSFHPLAAVAAATLLGVALVLTLRAFFAGPSARA